MAATLKDLARETGLGLATLSKYFNGGTVREKNRLLFYSSVFPLVPGKNGSAELRHADPSLPPDRYTAI